MSIYFGGSRHIFAAPILAHVVSAVLAAGQVIHVGCSAGADQLVISRAIRSRSFSQVSVFAAFGAGGQGSWSGSAVKVVQGFCHGGGSVSWLAGGPLSVPLSARLILRSVAGLRGCSAAVFFSPGPGSLAVAAHAVAAGIPVFAFGSMPAAPRGCAGSWVASQFFGFSCWAWSPAQLSLL